MNCEFASQRIEYYYLLLAIGLCNEIDYLQKNEYSFSFVINW